jgi:hypothetical protein
LERAFASPCTADIIFEVEHRVLIRGAIDRTAFTIARSLKHFDADFLACQSEACCFENNNTFPHTNTPTTPNRPLLSLLRQTYHAANMTSFLENAYTIVGQDNSAQASVQELKMSLEKGSDEVKIETLKKILGQMLSGSPMPEMLMHIIRFVMPSRDKKLKKLLYHYYELSSKHDQNGKLRQEWILVCELEGYKESQVQD